MHVNLNSVIQNNADWKNCWADAGPDREDVVTWCSSPNPTCGCKVEQDEGLVVLPPPARLDRGPSAGAGVGLSTPNKFSNRGNDSVFTWISNLLGIPILAGWKTRGKKWKITTHNLSTLGKYPIELRPDGNEYEMRNWNLCNGSPVVSISNQFIDKGGVLDPMEDGHWTFVCGPGPMPSRGERQPPAHPENIHFSAGDRWARTERVAKQVDAALASAEASAADALGGGGALAAEAPPPPPGPSRKRKYGQGEYFSNTSNIPFANLNAGERATALGRGAGKAYHSRVEKREGERKSDRAYNTYINHSAGGCTYNPSSRRMDGPRGSFVSNPFLKTWPGMYENTGYERGHIQAARAFQTRGPGNQSFRSGTMANLAPQTPNFQGTPTTGSWYQIEFLGQNIGVSRRLHVLNGSLIGAIRDQAPTEDPAWAIPLFRKKFKGIGQSEPITSVNDRYTSSDTLPYSWIGNPPGLGTGGPPYMAIQKFRPNVLTSETDSTPLGIQCVNCGIQDLTQTIDYDDAVTWQGGWWDDDDWRHVNFARCGPQVIEDKIGYSLMDGRAVVGVGPGDQPDDAHGAAIINALNPARAECNPGTLYTVPNSYANRSAPPALFLGPPWHSPAGAGAGGFATAGINPTGTWALRPRRAAYYSLPNQQSRSGVVDPDGPPAIASLNSAPSWDLTKKWRWPSSVDPDATIQGLYKDPEWFSETPRPGKFSYPQCLCQKFLGPHWCGFSDGKKCGPSVRDNGTNNWMIPQPCKWTKAGESCGTANATACGHDGGCCAQDISGILCPPPGWRYTQPYQTATRSGKTTGKRKHSSTHASAWNAASPKTRCILGGACTDEGKQKYVGIGLEATNTKDAQISSMIIPDSFFQIFIEERPPHADNPEGKPWMWIFINRDPGINQAIEILDKTRTKVIWSGCRMSPGGSSKWPCKFDQKGGEASFKGGNPCKGAKCDFIVLQYRDL